ncbi:MAG: hypothetical protein KGI08_04800 [Thaumarchaeota archaeon]|nr:hypothetical protein [Nitrososphaerota archaeon]
MDTTTQLHICGLCNAQFPTEEAYIGHTCEASGFTPADPEHAEKHTPGFAAISAAAVQRGELIKKKMAEGKSLEDAQKEAQEETTTVQ